MRKLALIILFLIACASENQNTIPDPVPTTKTTIKSYSATYAVDLDENGYPTGKPPTASKKKVTTTIIIQ
jgi:outer membrane lipoprotein-sorting protein